MAQLDRVDDCEEVDGTRRRERGAAMVEYFVLVGTMAVMSMTMVSKLGTLIETELAYTAAVLEAERQAELADEEEDENSGGVGTCPNKWELIGAGSLSKKNGQNVDANGDGFICQFNIPGQGNGNTNQNSNVKDNNGPPA